MINPIVKAVIDKTEGICLTHSVDLRINSTKGGNVLDATPIVGVSMVELTVVCFFCWKHYYVYQPFIANWESI